MKILFSINSDLNPLFNNKKSYLIDSKYKIYYLEDKQILSVNRIDIYSLEILTAFIMLSSIEKYPDFWRFVRTVRKFEKKNMHSIPEYHYELKEQYLSTELWLKKKKLKFLEGENITDAIKNLIMEISVFLYKNNKDFLEPIKKYKKIQKKSFRKEVLSRSGKSSIGVFHTSAEDLHTIKNLFDWYGTKRIFFDILLIYIEQKEKVFLSVDDDTNIIAKELLELASNSDSNINGNRNYAYIDNCSKKEFKKIIDEVIDLL